MIWAEIVGGDVGKDEVLGRYGASGETTQQGELAGVRHCVGEGALQEDLGGDAVKLSAEFDVTGHVGEDLVEVLDGGGKFGSAGGR